MTLTPFFVADRPASLLILKGVLLKYSQTKVGIMTHAFTSQNFWQMFKNFPYNTQLLYENKSLLREEDMLNQSLVKMADSGIFSKTGCTVGYEELFHRYNLLGTHYGIMIDVLKNSKATLKSAMKALKTYEKNEKKYYFKLVAVAQGNNLDEYLECYGKLRKYFEFVAVGGLLKKREKSARYVTVGDEDFLYEVLNTIRKAFSPKWLYALGSYHPTRHKRFQEIGVWGSDYKGWIFNYKRRLDTLYGINEDLKTSELKNGFSKYLLSHLNQVDESYQNLQILEKKWREEKDQSKKKTFWTQLNSTRNDLENNYLKLKHQRELLFRNNHLPPHYKKMLSIFIRFLNSTDQQTRFQQVRNYIETNVYSQCW